MNNPWCKENGMSNRERFKLLGLLLCILAMVPGCGGCRREALDKDSTATEKKKDKVVDRLKVDRLRALPAASGSDLLLLKPGHWYELQQPVKANFGDESIEVSCNIVDQVFHPLSMLGLREPIAFERSIALARGQEKRLDYQVFVPSVPPPLVDLESAVKPQVRVNYMPRGVGVSLREEVYPITVIPDYQFYLVALSKATDAYQFLEGSTALVWPSEGKLEDEKVFPIRLVSIEESQASASLPTRLNTWSSTSHLLWNDCAATAFTEQQKAAIVDWLHFGGQIIVNGPESQSALANSFLSDYLPIVELTKGSNAEIDWDAFNSKWSISTIVGQQGTPIVMPQDRDVPSISGKLVPGARWVSGCEGIAAERMVGAGRVVMTTFPIAESTWIRWPSYSSFINAVLLARPPRIWAHDSNQLGDLVFVEPFRGFEKDPTLTSRFRLLARDLGARSATLEPPSDASIINSLRVPESQLNAIAAEAELEAELKRIRSGEPGTRRSIGELSSQGGFTRPAGQVLRQASGINVPSISTIIKLLAAYLVVLVPINWIVFWLIGRVELAWIAAPVIAIIGAFAIARAVQLDVGFSRSQTSISVVEVPSGYSRGYSASFTSLYTSLTTNYSAFNSESNGMVVPMLTREERMMSFTRDTPMMTYRYASDRGEGLESFPVRSNSTSFIRAEQPCEIGGEVTLTWSGNNSDSIQVENRSSLNFARAGIVAMDNDGQMRKGWVGNIDGGNITSVAVDLAAVANDSTERTTNSRKVRALFLDEWELEADKADPKIAKSFGQNRDPKDGGDTNIYVKPLITSLLTSHFWQPGEAMMVGICNKAFSPIVINPLAPQRQEQSLFVVHLFTESIGTASPDINIPKKSAASEEDLDPAIFSEELTPAK
ncbi:MAG: hypothetical protein NTW52_06325 [Planctomycetota bacterium]|nr:hypothetical protein [Planctomycetota bacterium]